MRVSPLKDRVRWNLPRLIKRGACCIALGVFINLLFTVFLYSKSFHLPWSPFSNSFAVYTTESESRCNVTVKQTVCDFDLIFFEHHINDTHCGSLKLQNITVAKWNTTAPFILVHVSDNCQVNSYAEITTSDLESTDIKINNFVGAIFRRDLVFGVLYGDSITNLRGIFHYGLTTSHQASFINGRGILAFKFRKGFPGHSDIVVIPTGNNSSSITGRHVFGKAFDVQIKNITADEVILQHPEIKPGGTWSPACVPHSRVALIIAFRDRHRHLWPFLENMFRFLEAQFIEFRIFLIEQAGEVLFNRAKLMNIGYSESMKYGHFDCFIFHDVDLVPEDMSHSYACTENPQLLAVTRSEKLYLNRFPYYFGGAIMLKREHMELINGFPKRYYGWGGEDDEIWARLKARGIEIDRPPQEIGYYMSLPNFVKDETNPKMNRSSDKILHQASEFMTKDGLNTLNYSIIISEEKKLFTHVITEFHGPKHVDDVKDIFEPERT